VDPTLKAARLANYIITLRKDVLTLSRACGAPHPALITADHLRMKWRLTDSGAIPKRTPCLISLLPVIVRARRAASCRS
jgi:hypothetical protein